MSSGSLGGEQLADQHRRHRRQRDTGRPASPELDPDSTDEHQPSWSPDTATAFLFEKDFTCQVGIFNPDGSGFRLVGPEVFE